MLVSGKLRQSSWKTFTLECFEHAQEIWPVIHLSIVSDFPGIIACIARLTPKIFDFESYKLVIGCSAPIVMTFTNKWENLQNTNWWLIGEF